MWGALHFSYPFCLQLLSLAQVHRPTVALQAAPMAVLEQSASDLHAHRFRLLSQAAPQTSPLLQSVAVMQVHSPQTHLPPSRLPLQSWSLRQATHRPDLSHCLELPQSVVVKQSTHLARDTLQDGLL